MVQKYIQKSRFCLLIFIIGTLAAQAQVLEWSNPIKLKGGATFTKVIGENQHGTFLLRYRNRFYTKNIILERFNHQLTFEKSIHIELRKARLSKLYITAKGILLIKAKYIRQHQENRLIAQWYDFDFIEMGDPVLLATSNAREYGDRGNFRVRISDDLQKILVLTTEKYSTPNTLIHYRIFTDALVPNKGHTFSLNYPDAKIVLQDLVVTNTSSISILARITPKSLKRDATSNFHLITLHDSTLYARQVTDSVNLKSPKLTYNRKLDQAIVTSFYSLKNMRGIVGTLFYTPGNPQDLPQLVWSKFSTDLIDEITLNDRNEDAVSEGFYILRTIPRSDGGILIIAEQKNIATEDDIILVNGLPQSTLKNIYNFNEVLVLNYDDSAYLDWHKLITKNQTTVNDGGYFSSVVIYTGPKYIQLIYNDQLRSSGEVMQHTIYNNGMEKSQKLLKTEIDFVAIVPSESKQVSSKKVIVPTSKNRRFALLKLVYN
ncbi:MAG: hypothetical protein P8N47_04505 [Bacteroidia bacterium]|jgi:hypothetical protein|nr:hypothetical protein [Bacteroidia bacterium]